MPFQVWIYSALVALSVPVLWWALTGNQTVSPKAVRNLGAGRSSNLRTLRLEQPAAERIALPVLRQAGLLVQRFTPLGWIGRYERYLGEAGRLGRWSPEQVVGAKIVLGSLAILWRVLAFLNAISASQLLIGIFVVGIGFYLPDLLLSSMASRRKDEIELQLPDVLDQLTMSVEAGLSFEAAMGRIAAKNDHVLAREFARLIQDIKLGTPRSEALADLGNRSGVEDLRHVVLSLRQAEKLGVPLAQTLRTIADQMRIKRGFRAEEKAHKLPVKMIFPLGMCIMPALFIVILGPAAIQIREVF